MLYLGNYGELSAAITRRAERLAQLSGRFMQTRESSARGRAALKAKCGHQRDCIFCSQENRKSRPSPVNGLQPPLPRGAVPKCGAQLTGGARRRRICERCLQHQSRRFYCISQPAGAREEREPALFHSNLQLEGGFAKLPSAVPRRWLSFGPWVRLAQVLYRSIWVRIKAACRRLAAK
jgi:hypothetical protein